MGLMRVRNGKVIGHGLRIMLLTLLVSLPPAVSANSTALPEFQLPLLQGDRMVPLKEFRGKVVYVDFWASWCGPCRKAMPLYEAMYQELGTEKFEILAINLDEDPQDATKFLTKYPVTYPVLSDVSGSAAEAWGVKVMPTSYLLDPSGQVIRVYPGFEASHLERIRHDINTLLLKH